MKGETLVYTLTVFTLAIAGRAELVAQLGSDTKAHLVAAQQAAGVDFPAALTYCDNIVPGEKQFNVPTVSQLRLQGGPAGAEPGPARIFDNLYYLGVRQANAYAVDTPEGIILLDALNSAEEVVTQVEGGMRELGLDPGRIRYLVITHAHPDHYGGAKYLQDTFDIQVLMGAPDWDAVAARAEAQPDRPLPARDRDITDGMELPGGVRLYLTPGHTPGTIIAMIPVSDNGEPHVAVVHGGSGMGRDPVALQQYIESQNRSIDLSLAARADVPLSNHTENDRSILKIDQLKQRRPGDPHPFVLGSDAVRRLFTSFRECAQAHLSNQ